MDPHDKAAGVRVAPLLAVDDVGLLRDEDAGDGVHDPDAVGAGQGQDKLHPLCRRWPQPALDAPPVVVRKVSPDEATAAALSAYLALRSGAPLVVDLRL